MPASSRANFSKMCACASAGTPMPSSLTSIDAPPGRSLTRTSTLPPSGEYLTALSSRFNTTWRRRDGSHSTSTLPGASTENVCLRACTLTVSVALSQSARRSHVSRLSLTSPRSTSAETRICSISSFRRAGARASPREGLLDQVELGDQLAQRACQRLGLRHPEDPLGGAVPVENAVVVVQQGDGCLHVLERMRGAVAALSGAPGGLLTRVQPAHPFRD